MGCFNSTAQLPALAFLGLCDSGKSTIIAYIEHQVFRLTHPTLGVEISTAIFQDQRVEIWDVSGRDCSYWSKYYNSASGIVFVVDSSNEKDFNSFIDHAKQTLSNPIVQKLPVLIYVNRSQPDTLEKFKEELTEKLELKQSGITYQLMPCDPKTGKGVNEGFDWIMKKALLN
ncbi:small GTP-binding protein, putative [Trichomonas vaginalis G3]|uniref:Small GTP-binding protein, putative n=1 Tax=Trichomonas vaginalis (strain ATCC PRA-98 / G3) TaxID=412133 RepID=A2FYW3_TRIV3|nr:GTP binding [Trichomonas vaginalis G3]EAX89903.1 small GTP-binding protein, putative [Trichomonas vaginalis G3]KAI5532333.1 GTP binding [Trichomonas vaginalis G3]|eukprot:XP_001302833.1 small GTP-binding protein [Trichomonas vaginalis G3]